MTAALRFNNLTLGYDRHPAVHHLSGEVGAGALMAVVGPNGAGKSTLFKGIVGVIKPLAGRIERYVRLVGVERVMAGVDCGFSIHAGMRGIDPDVVWAKLASLAQGAELAARRSR